MGQVQLPEQALWGAQTQRALENFSISGETFGRTFIRALGLIKAAAARANQQLGWLDDSKAEAVIAAAEQVAAGHWDDHFPVDVFQTGSGTSTNMNANEVIANLANRQLGGKVGAYQPVHPNDHVNLSQSSNDVFPSAIHLAAVLAVREELIPALQDLEGTFSGHADTYQEVVKTGRTHLQDALPVRMGQVFGGYAAQIRKTVSRLEHVLEQLSVLPLGGTAVGTGANRPEDFPGLAVDCLRESTGVKFAVTGNHMEGNASRDDLVEASGMIKTAAVGLTKIANDLRWMASGPRAGLSEIELPKVQPGSSIMPGKNNPVVAEALIMTAAQVIGSEAAVTQGGLGGVFEINLMMPLIAYNLLNSIHWLAGAVQAFDEKTVRGIRVNHERCRELLERNLTLVTALAPRIGYERASEISQEAQRTGQTIFEVAQAWEVLPEEELKRLLDPLRLTGPEKGDQDG
jgi:fumarate hydratase class II